MPNFQIRFFIVTILFLFFIFFVTLFYSLPSNVLSKGNDSNIRSLFNAVYAQQFGFFTRDSQNEQEQAFSITKNGEIHSLILTPQNRKENLFGLSRRQRAQGPEFSHLFNTNGLIYKNCNSDSFLVCLHNNLVLKAQKLVNNSPIPSVCGNVFLIYGMVTDWSYRNIMQNVYVGNKIAHADVSCIYR